MWINFTSEVHFRNFLNFTGWLHLSKIKINSTLQLIKKTKIVFVKHI